MGNHIIIIAEIGINHNGDMALARELIKHAKSCGCDIAKFQLYSVEGLFPTGEIWAQGKNWYEEVKRTELDEDMARYLEQTCRAYEIEFMASAFDLERLGWLESFGVKHHKIATRMNRNREYINIVLSKGKETFISCQNPDDIPLLVSDIPDRNRNKPVVPVKTLYCVPNYPTMYEEIHLKNVCFQGQETFQGEYSIFDGLSDHSKGITSGQIAISRGAKIIEKHFTLDKLSSKGPDHICSIEPPEMRTLVQFARDYEEITYGERH